MFNSRRHVTVIAQGLKIAGNVSAEGSVELHGEVEGELHCRSLRISEKGRIAGKIVANEVIVNGTVEGPIHATHVALESKARVTGDVHHQSFKIDKGAFFDGSSKQKDAPAKERAPLHNGSTQESDSRTKSDQETAAAQ